MRHNVVRDGHLRHNGGRDGVAQGNVVGGVRDAHGLDDVLHNGADGGISVSLYCAVGEVAAQTVRLDDGAVQTGSAHEGGVAGD